MRRFILFLLFFLICSFSYAGVTGEVLAVDRDDNGNIRVKTQYKIDGVEVKSRYPKLNGKYYWVSRYRSHNFADMTDLEIKNRILRDVRKHSENLITDTFFRVDNERIINNNLPNLIGSMIIRNQSKVLIDIDGDNVFDKEWTVKTDGTKTERIITP